jgi:hypothetical protein
MYPYAYLVWCLMFVVVWLTLYYIRKDTRREMVLMSFFSTPLGPISEYFHVMDYWRPETITGTLIGPEDVIIAFLIGGISAVLYEFLYQEKRERSERPGIFILILVSYAVGAGILAFGMWLGLGSVVTTFTLLSLFIAVPLALRPRLIQNSFLSGIAFMTFLFLFYKVFIWMYPGIVDAWWFGASGVRVLGVPVEELTWGFLWGMVAGICSELVARLKIPRILRW